MESLVAHAGLGMRLILVLGVSLACCWAAAAEPPKAPARDAATAVDAGDNAFGIGEYASALASYQAALRLDPQSANGHNSLAWLRATCPDASFRDGAQAVEHAKLGCVLSGWKNPGFIDTLAAAYAEHGEFDQATQYATRAMDAAPASEKRAFALRLEKYQRRSPYRDRASELCGLFVSADQTAKNDPAHAAAGYRQALAVAQDSFGPRSALASIALDRLSACAALTGGAAAARASADEARAIRQEVLAAKDLEEVGSLNRVGAVIGPRGGLATARLCLEQALALRKGIQGEKHPFYAVTLVNLANTLADAGDYGAARSYFEQAAAIRKEILGEKHPDYAASLHDLGHLLKLRGDFPAARSHLEQALAIRKETLSEKHLDTAASYNELGLVLRETGDYQGAGACFERALAIRKELLGERHPRYASSLDGMGWVLEGMGDFTAARACYEQAQAIRKEVLGEKDTEYAASLNNLGNLRAQMGDYAAAAAYYEQALAIYKELLGETHPFYGTLLGRRGAMLRRLGNPTAALPYYEQSLAIIKQTKGDKHPQYSTMLNNIGVLHMELGDAAAARRYLEMALAIDKEVLGEKHAKYGAALENVGGMILAMDDVAAARPYLEKALAIKVEALGENHPDVASTLDFLTYLEAFAGHWDAAATYKDRARRIIRRHVARVLPGLAEKEQLTFLQSTDEEPFHVGLTLGLARRADQAIAARSASWLLNGKAVAQESLADRARMALESRDTRMAEVVKELLDVRRQLAATGLAAPQPGQERARKEQLAQLSAREQALSRRLAASGEQTFAEPWVELDAVRAALPPDGALVDIARFDLFNFVAGSNQPVRQPAHYVAWITPPAGKGEVQIVDLGPADAIDAAVASAQRAMQAAMGAGAQPSLIQTEGEPGAEKTLQKSFGALARYVLAPLVATIGDAKHLLISPDAALWLVPWGALPLADGRYAIEQYNIHYVVSGRDLARRSVVRTKTSKPAVMANPNYDLTPAAALAATRAVLRGAVLPDDKELQKLSNEISQLPSAQRLPGTAAEANAIEGPLGDYAHDAPTLYTDTYALEAVFKALQRPKALVLATHGFFLADQEARRNERAAGAMAAQESPADPVTAEGKPLENPLLRCGLLLAGCNSHAKLAGLEDGVLTGMEIVGADLRGTDLVVLSACETGLGQVRNGEGVAGLRQAFQLAGAEAVVATLWQIPDKQSAQLMTDFFTNLAAGQAKDEALRNAQLAMIAQRREKFSAAHPFYWAAFTLTGK